VSAPAPALDEALPPAAVEAAVAEAMRTLVEWPPVAGGRNAQLALTECLSALFAMERLDGANKFDCDRCRRDWELQQKMALVAHAPLPPLPAANGDDAAAAAAGEGQATEPGNGDGVVPAAPAVAEAPEAAADDGATPTRNPAKKSPPKPQFPRTVASKRLFLKRPPRVLTVHLNRFMQTGYALRKNSEAVTFDLQLDLSPACAPDVPCAAAQYELYAVVEHSGTMTGGHYVAYVRLPTTPVWYYVSDSSVRASTESEVLRAQAYLLFYRRRQPVPPTEAAGDVATTVGR